MPAPQLGNKVHVQPRVLVMWAEPSSPNLGVRALATGVQELIGPDAEVTFASHHSPLTSGALSVKRLVKALVVPGDALIRELRSFDLVIDLGEGDSFATIYGPKRYAKMILSKLAVLRAKPPLILAPQTLGPWEGRVAHVAARHVQRRAAAVWARDSASAARATVLGVENVRLASDLVFAIAQPPTTRSEPRSQRALFNVSGLLWNQNPHIDFQAYRHLIRECITALLDEGASVDLLVHVASATTEDDDLVVAHDLAREFPSTAVLAPDGLERVRAEIAAVDMVVGSRMHACLNAVSVGVPAVPLAYSDKFESLFADLHLKHFCDLRREPERAARIVVEAWRDEHAMTATRIARETASMALLSFADDVQRALQ